MSERQGRYAVRVDANQGEIVRALADAGYTVHDTHALGKGFPDLAVNVGGIIVLLEVKTSDGTLTDAERVFHLRWYGAPIFVVRNADEAKAFLASVNGAQQAEHDLKNTPVSQK